MSCDITFAMRIKDVMANMPVSLNTKKEIDEYFKKCYEKYEKRKSC